MPNTMRIYMNESNESGRGTLEYKGKKYKMTIENGKINYFEILPDGSLKEDFGIERKLKKTSFIKEAVSKLDNRLRKFIFNRSCIPQTDVVKIGNAVFVNKSTHEQKKKKQYNYEFSHFE